jgi:hypothetical protein
METLVTQKFNVLEFLERLKKARAEGRVEIEVDFTRVTHPSSPLPFESFKGKIAYIYLGLVVVLLAASRAVLHVSWRDTLIVIGVASLVYWILARRLLERWAKKKIVDQLLSDSEGWEKMWRFGGVTLTVQDPAEPLVWVAPKGDWKEASPKL